MPRELRFSTSAMPLRRLMNSSSTFLKKIIKPFLEVRPCERTKTFLMFFYFFLTIALIYILKPAQKSLFLAEFGAAKLPYANIGEGLFLILVVNLYIQFAKRASRKQFYFGVLAFFFTNLILFWVLLKVRVPFISAFFYVWQASFAITITTVFWALANDLFNPDEAKRLFGLIISGGSLGGILGGVFASQLVRWMKTEDLLLAAAAVLIVSVNVVALIWKKLPAVDAAEKISQAEKADFKSSRSVFSIFKSSPYFVMLAVVVILPKIASTIIDNQFNAVAETAIHGKENLTAFFGWFFALLNGISFLMQLGATSLSLRVLGVGFSLGVLPLGLAVFSSVALTFPILWVAVAYRIYDGSINYSIQQASKEILYLPISPRIRAHIKPVIDMLGFRGAKLIAGLLMAVAVAWVHLDATKLSILVLFLMPFWFWIAWQMKSQYAKHLKKQLLHHSLVEIKKETYYRVPDILRWLEQEKTFHSMRSLIHQGSPPARKLLAVAFLSYASNSEDVQAACKILQRLAREEALEKSQDHKNSTLTDKDQAFIRALPGIQKAGSMHDEHFSEPRHLQKWASLLLTELGDLLQDSEASLEQKRQSVRILEFLPTQETVDLLLPILGNATDHALRFILISAFNRILAKNDGAKMDRVLIKKEIFKEINICHHLIKANRYCKARHKNEDMVVALNALYEESLERAFRCLDLLYPYQGLRLIFDHITYASGNGVLRSQAIELLHHSVETDMMLKFQEVLVDSQEQEVSEEEMISLVKSFFQSGDRWFLLAGHFLVRELNLPEKCHELAQFQEESDFQKLQF